MLKVLCFLLIVIPNVLTEGYGERTKDEMYLKISATTPCYRRLNATHQIGCSSKRGGSTGAVHYCRSIEDLDFILTNGSAPPYIPVLLAKLFTQNILQKMITSQKVSGLVLHSNNDSLEYLSHESQCPNPLSSYENTCNRDFVWNPHGTGLLYADIPFPVFYIESEKEVLKIRECFDKFNNYSHSSQNDRSLCSLELKSFMYATTNTPTCRRRSNIISNLNPVKFCDPLGDSNVWASLYPLVEGPRNETKPIRGSKYIVITTKMDTTSMFDRTSGANSPVSGMVTLLTVAKYLKNMLSNDDVRKAKTNVLFILFNGETYDYIGSQRLLYDMLNGDFPVKDLEDDNDILPIIRPEDISLFIELSQLGNSRGNLFVHYWKKKKEINEFLKKLQQHNNSLTIQNISSSLPPASLHTFLKLNNEFPGLIIADHKKSYTNNFYNSIFDDALNIGYEYYNSSERGSDIPKNSVQYFIANVSAAVGAAVCETIKGEQFRQANGAEQLVPLVNELFLCYLEDPNCKVHMATQIRTLPSDPLSLYVGVDHASRYATTLTALSLGWLTGDVEKDNASCSNKPRNYAFKYYNMSKSLDELNVTVCYKITMNTTEAYSPAFLIADYNWTSGVYSTWTESTWSDINVRMFLKPSSAHERMTIAIGSISLIFSFIFVYFINSRSHLLFALPLPTEGPTDC